MAEAEHSLEGFEPDKGSDRGPQWLDDLVTIHREKNHLTEEDGRRLTEAALVRIRAGATVRDAFEGAVAADAVETMTLERALQIIERVVTTRSREETFLLLLTAAMDHVVDFFDSVYYLIFSGKTGSGKGTAVESVLLMCRPGSHLIATSTEAAFRSIAADGLAVGVEQASDLMEKDPNIRVLLLNSNRRGVKTAFRFQGPSGKWETAELETFGVKFFDVRKGADAHLLSRAIVIEMEEDLDFDKALDAEKKERILRVIQSWLLYLGSKARAGKWSRDYIDSRRDDPEYRTRVKAICRKGGRSAPITCNLVDICDIFGWPTDLIGGIMARRKAFDEFDNLAEVLEVVRALSSERAPGDAIPVSEVLAQANALKEKAGERYRYNVRTLGAVLSDLGFKRPKEWYKERAGPYRNQSVIVPTRVLSEYPDTGASAPILVPPREESDLGMTRTDRARATLPSVEPALSISPQVAPDLSPDPPKEEPKQDPGEPDLTEDEREANRIAPPDPVWRGRWKWGDPLPVVSDEIMRALETMGPAILYPDGRVADRITGTILFAPAPPGAREEAPHA